MSSDFCPYVTTQYSIEMNEKDNELDVFSTIDALVSNSDSPLLSLFKNYTVFEIGVTTDKKQPTDRMRKKMGLRKSKESGLFVRRVDSFKRMEGICIWFKNVLSEDGEFTSKICEKYLQDKLSNQHHGICLSTPQAHSKGINAVKDAFGYESFGLYVDAANPFSNYFFKEDLRKGRMGSEKEKALHKAMVEAEHAEMLKEIKKILPEHSNAVEEQGEVIASQAAKLDELGTMIEEQRNMLKRMAIHLGIDRENDV